VRQGEKLNVANPDLRKLFVEAARAKKPGEAVDARLDALAVYVRYLELYKKYAAASDSNRVQVAREVRAQRRICFLRSNYAKKLRRTRRRTQTTKAVNANGSFREGLNVYELNGGCCETNSFPACGRT
jgi:hypothetical protein